MPSHTLARRPATRDDRPDLWDLVDQARDGDTRAFADLFTATAGPVYGMVYRRVFGDRQAAEEIVSDVYVSAWRTLPNVSRRAGSPLAWLATIARCRVIDHGRVGRHHRNAVPLGNLADIADDYAGDTSAEDHCIAHAEARAQRAHLDALWAYAERQLTPDQHRVLRYRFRLGLSVEDTAAAIGKPRAAVKALQHRAIESLRRQLAGTHLDPTAAAA